MYQLRAFFWGVRLKEKRMICVNCHKPIPKKLYLGIKVVQNGKDIGTVCNDCLMGVNTFRLLLVGGLNKPFELKEYQPLPSSNR
jgi:hypothetical protein